MRHRGIALGAHHERWMYAALAAVYFTGIAWMILHYAVNGGDALDGPWRIAETWALRAHGAAAMAALIAFGSVLAVHVPRAWLLARNLVSGVAMLATALVLAATGWLLYYAAGEAARAWSDYLHMAIGALAPLALLWHLQFRRAERLSSARR